jgi:hypothetical protein
MPDLHNATHTILPPLFCPPVQWFAQLCKSDILISETGTLQKQSLLNRCWIKTAQGPFSLTLPLIHTGAARRYEEARISYHENWPVRMLRTFTTNYRKSAYFEYYYPDLEAILLAKPEYLHSLNHELMVWMCRVFQLTPVFQEPAIDFRLDEIMYPPTLSSIALSEVPYFQLYGDFIQGLSALDLLFHYGPDAYRVLGKFKL